MSILRNSLVSLFVLTAASMGACAKTDDPGKSGDDGNEAIKGGSAASAYPEAVLVDMYQGGQLYAYCSGSLIAPSVVMTAGHCVYQTTSWKITAPFANGQTATASKGSTYDWTNTSESVNPKMHDIGLIFLDSPIQLTTYPEIPQQPVQNGSKLVNIGRIDNGQLSTTSLFVSPPITVNTAQSEGFPYDYDAQEEIQPGDSGGPDIVPGTHTIAAVNSGAGSDEVLARTDLLYSWIEQEIQQNGGPGSGGTGGGGGSGSTGSGSGSSSSSGSGSGSGSGSSSTGSGSSSGGGSLDEGSSDSSGSSDGSWGSDSSDSGSDSDWSGSESSDSGWSVDDDGPGKKEK